MAMTESVQKKLLRVRPPRVKITYDVETGGALEKKELPFIVLILADLVGPCCAAPLPPVRDRKPILMDRDNFNDVLQSLAPQFNLAECANVMPGGQGQLTGTLAFKHLDDFSPLGVIRQISALGELHERQVSSSDADRALGAQLDGILHAPAFQQLEATWRGLHRLIMRTETSSMLQLRVLQASKKDLHDDLTQALEIDQSSLYKITYEAEYGISGGQPYGLLLCDSEFGDGQSDIDLLNKLAQVAAAAHAPLVTAASPELFGLSSFSFLDRPRDLKKIFEGLSLELWRIFRESEASRHVTLTMPRVLLRPPYGQGGIPCDGVRYQEDDAPDDLYKLPNAQSNFLWGNAAYFLVERITHAFALYGWTAAIRGVEGGGLVDDLPACSCKNDAGNEVAISPTQVTLTAHRTRELDDLGFLPLCHIMGTHTAAFSTGNHGHLTQRNINETAHVGPPFADTLPCMLAASRFAHYVKAIMREKVGSFMTRGNVEAYLNSWIAQYVLLDERASPEVKAAYPLRAATINVTDVPGRPGSYMATMFLRPHFQLEELATSIRLEAVLPG
jgi:type VI secretion system protein ImpC